MVGSLLITFDEVVKSRGVSFFFVTVNGEARNTHYTDTNRLYTTDLFVGDVCTVCMSGQTQYGESIGIIRRDYTTDDQSGDKGIIDNNISNQVGGPGLCVTFTATTVSNAYNFEYRILLSYTLPTPTPTPTQLPCFNDLQLSGATGVGGLIGATALLIDNNNKILFGGPFNRYGGGTGDPASTCIGRVTEDGLRDFTFDSSGGTDIFEANPIVEQITRLLQQSDGKYLILGQFSAYGIPAPPYSVSRQGIARINYDGSIDTSFGGLTGFSISNGYVYDMALQSDGKVIVVGDFISYSGATKNGIVRLNTNGTIDSSFVTGTGFTDTMFNVKIQSNGKIVCFGYSTNSYNGTSFNNVIRLNTDGSVDTSFTSALSYGSAKSGYLLSTGKMIIGGGGTSGSKLFMLNSDGSLDSSFVTGTGIDDDSRSIVYCFYELPSGQIMVGGSFIYYQGITRNKLLRLNIDGSLDTSFDANDAFLYNGNSLYGEYYGVLDISYRSDVQKFYVAGLTTLIIGIERLSYNGASEICFVPTPTPTPTPVPILVNFNWNYSWSGASANNISLNGFYHTYNAPGIPTVPTFFRTTPYKLTTSSGSISGSTTNTNPDIFNTFQYNEDILYRSLTQTGVTYSSIQKTRKTYKNNVLIDTYTITANEPIVSPPSETSFTANPSFSGITIVSGDTIGFEWIDVLGVAPTPTPTPTPIPATATPTPTPTSTPTITPTPLPPTSTPTPTPTGTPTPTPTSTPTPTPTPAPVTLNFNGLSSSACFGFGCASTSGTLVQYFSYPSWITKTVGTISLNEGESIDLRIYNGSAGTEKGRLRILDSSLNVLECSVNNSLTVGNSITITYYNDGSLAGQTIELRPEACRTASGGGGSCGAPNYSC